MNLTSQYIVNPKSRDAYFNSESIYKSIRTTSTRLRVSDDRYVLNSRKKRVSFQVEGIGFNMLYCPKGKFVMGPNNILTKIKRPFLLGETEVTQELFEEIMGYNSSGFQELDYPNSSQRPVENITWYDAVRFCNKLSEKLGKKPYYNFLEIEYEHAVLKTNIKSAKVTINPQANGFRLPSEKEWEYAAKAGTNNQFAGTNDVYKLDEIAWFNENSNNQTHSVKGRRPNEWGFYDMTGNVWEWGYDLFVSDSNDFRVSCGGGWYNDPSNLQSAYHYYESPSCRNGYIGFRVASPLVN
jgi:sulfatase modifying factor 1